MPVTSGYRVSDLNQNAPTVFDLKPDSATCLALAEELGLQALRKLSFKGQITAERKRDWRLSARLGATAVQTCIVTLDPVTTRIDTDVTRLFLADFPEAEETEAEMIEDETQEPLSAFIDPAAIMAEALAIALPDYPRKDGAELEQTVFTLKDAAPLRDEDLKPFAGLAALRDQMKKPGDA